jgi:GNAT superfamily N-acetyltransferase
MSRIVYTEDRDLPLECLKALYTANHWSAVRDPEILLQALQNSHTLITAWDEGKLIGLANAISDGCLVVYYPHLLVLPDYQGEGIGTEIVRRLLAKYEHFHQQVLITYRETVPFYKHCGFSRAAAMEPLWIYEGRDH